ncbi:MAG TPA: alpha/beta hydrolase [Noviherbaspirillum sp.]|uniref:alpha/beta fold hydrolase n=1 Tax=Noviherbaspirillum sp. TaxID=1926288 RepID=UPI002B46FA88|nr:alpha/beta hydrolase [Noviherbaspirillum sp.]HJV84681.1 alpha/beta hydrolase [Noviherbaspirillum sp.]
MNDSLVVRIRAAIDAARADAEFIQAIAGLPFQIGLRIGRGKDAPVLHLLDTAAAPMLVQLCADERVWEEFTLPCPPVGFHSFTAAARDPARLSLEGEAVNVAQSLHALERFFELLRGQSDDDVAPLAGMEHLSGHYIRLEDCPEAENAVYYERSGNPQGPALLMLHTAGADARQFHPLMTDTGLRASWDMYAFDMPAHGRSLPNTDGLWQGYRLTKHAYTATCAAFIHTVIKRPTVVLGCSMGAAMALALGRQHPDDIAGIVALEAPFRAVGRKTPYLAHPQTNQAAHNPSYVRGLMSPSSPLRQRRIAAWIYSQGGFQVYSGDLAFYSEEFDAEHDLAGLDGTSKPIHLLTGAYDYSASPADSQRVADLIPGAVFTEMPDLGHFPMIENPAGLLRHLRPVMEQVHASLTGKENP